MNFSRIIRILGTLAIAAFANPTVSIFVKDPTELENLQKNLETIKAEMGADNPQLDQLLARAKKIAEMNDRCSMISINDVLDEECGRFYSIDLPAFEDQYMELTGEIRLNTVRMGNSLAERTEQITVCANALGGMLVSKDRLLKLDGDVALEPLDDDGSFDATYDFNLYFDSNRMKQQKSLMERWVEKCGEVVVRKAHDEFAPLFIKKIQNVNDSLEKSGSNAKIVLEPEFMDFYLDLNKKVSGSYFLNGSEIFTVPALPAGREFAHIIVDMENQNVKMPLGTDGKMQNFRGRVEFNAAYQEKDLMGRWFWGNKKTINRAKVKGEISSKAIVGDSTKPAPIVRKLASLDTTALITSVADTTAPADTKAKAANDAASDVSKDSQNSQKRKSLIPPVIASVVMIGGTIMAATYNSKAKDEYDNANKAPTQKEYDNTCDKIDNAQTLRAVGLGIAALGLVGLGFTLLF